MEEKIFYGKKKLLKQGIMRVVAIKNIKSNNLI